MPLSKDTLKSNILQAYNDILDGKITFDNPPDPAPPGMSKQLAAALADAYDKYAKQAQAGALTVSVPGVKATLESNLKGSEEYGGWAVGVGLYWAPVMFAGGGYIPANPVVPTTVTTVISGIAGDMPGYIKTERDSVDKAAGDLAELLHKHTTKLQVLSTTTSTPPVINMESVS